MYKKIIFSVIQKIKKKNKILVQKKSQKRKKKYPFNEYMYLKINFCNDFFFATKLS